MKLFFLFVLILIYLYFRLISTYELKKIFKSNEFNYLCNTFILMHKDNNFTLEEFFNYFKRLIYNNKILFTVSPCDDYIKIIKDEEELNNQVFIINSTFKWRFLIYNKNKILIVIFQNHRNFLGGQERIKLLNSLFNINNKTFIKKKNMDLNLNYILSTSPILLLSSIYNSPIIKNVYNRGFHIKKFNKYQISYFCKLNKCTINDFGICYATFLLINNKSIKE